MAESDRTISRQLPELKEGMIFGESANDGWTNLQSKLHKRRLTSSDVDTGINAFFAQLSSHGSLLKKVPLFLAMETDLTHIARPSDDVLDSDRNPHGPIQWQTIHIRKPANNCREEPKSYVSYTTHVDDSLIDSDVHIDFVLADIADLPTSLRLNFYKHRSKEP